MTNLTSETLSAMDVGAAQALARRLPECLPSAEVLRRRPDSMVARLRPDRGPSVIVKLWVRPGVRGVLRRVTRTSSVLREYRALHRLQGTGAVVPAPLTYFRVEPVLAPYTEGVLIGDLGPCVTAMEWIKGLIAGGREGDLRTFEAELIELTRIILSAGIIDRDHTVVNTVVPPSGRPARLDFELARWVGYPGLAPRALGAMLGGLLGSYTFAVQPDVERARRFAGHLAEAIRPSVGVLQRARRHVQKMMDQQREKVGIDTAVALPW